MNAVLISENPYGKCTDKEEEVLRILGSDPSLAFLGVQVAECIN